MDRLAGLLLGVEPPTVSPATGTSAGADDIGDTVWLARRERIMLARQRKARRRARIIGRHGL